MQCHQRLLYACPVPIPFSSRPKGVLLFPLHVCGTPRLGVLAPLISTQLLLCLAVCFHPWLCKLFV